ncbi:hypothetical protein cyc_05642 [Cyclospora cayetanensis]|uniref:Transmembrane protein n=1 Tax=Cyclospora cayetanensis TaxID=88456 RepID=A0A1D3CZL7_9EIME|nr:hypothetical protein cyc_05642 [Cyclospora cayetanensis]
MPLLRWNERWLSAALLLLSLLLPPPPAASFQVPSRQGLQRGSLFLPGRVAPSPAAWRVGTRRAQQSAAPYWSCASGVVPALRPPVSHSASRILATASREEALGGVDSPAHPLPFWDKVFSRKFLFSEALPSVIPPLEAALFAKANLAARFSGNYNRGFGVFGAGGLPALCIAAVAASVAAFGSWRLLNLASRSLRNVATQHRLAEAKAYGPLHSLDATIKRVPEGQGRDMGSREYNKGTSIKRSRSNPSKSLPSIKKDTLPQRTTAILQESPTRDQDTSEAPMKAGRLSSPKATKVPRGSSATNLDNSGPRKRRGRKSGKGVDESSIAPAGDVGGEHHGREDQDGNELVQAHTVLDTT